MIEIAIANLNLVIAVGVIIWAALQFVQKQKSPLRYYITLLYSMMAYVLLYFWSLRSGTIYYCPRLIYSNVPVAFAIGPVAYLYISRMLGIIDKFTGYSFLHFIPAILAGCVLVLCHVFDDSFMEFYLSNRLSSPVYEGFFICILDIISNIWVALYLLLAAARVYLKKSSWNKPAKELRAIFYLLIAVALTFLLVMYAHIINNHILLIYASVMNGALIVACFVFSNRNPGITQTVLTETRAGEKRAGLITFEAESVIDRLMQLVEIDKVYREPEITIQSLSNTLQISAYQLSLILNEKMNMNFRTFINFYRLEEAKDLLAGEPEKSIIEIAFAVGFNSKTSFNTHFSKTTGLSPSEYRKRFLKK